jgi:uncharacterized protein (DUF885 family)
MSDDETAAKTVANDYWEEFLQLDPLVATFIGDERYDDRLPDPSPEGQERMRALQERALQGIAPIDRARLDVDLRTTLDLLEFGAKRVLKDLDLRIDRLYAVTHLFGPGNLLADLATRQRADTPERLDRYVARLEAIPAYLQAIGDVAAEGAAAGQTQPALVVERTIAQIERLLSMPADESPGMDPVADAADEAKQRVATTLKDQVWPAYGAYLEMLRTYRGSSRDSVGLSAIKGGDGAYAAQIEAFTTVPLDPRRVHEIGLEQLAAIQEERRHIAEKLGFGTAEDALAEYAATGRNTAASREEYLRVVEDQVRRSWEAAPAFFSRLPSANCEVKMIEEFREADMPGAFYESPTMDGSRAGVYFVNTGEVQHRPLHQIATTSFHEANPGHHFQLSIEQEFTDRLPLRRFNPLSGDSFVEGWGLYSERLADDMGLFLNDYERIGMLEAQAFRAGRLIVDTGIHALGWDRERAIRQMMETGSGRLECEIEVDRYISWPGQACAYMIGQLEIQRWRRELSSRDPAGFDLRAFHDRLMSLGSLPLQVLEREILGTPVAG